MSRTVLVAAAMLAAAVWPALAQEPGSRQTRDYVQAAAQSDQFEIVEAQTALTASRDPQVRDFAQRMIAAHSQTAQALTEATAKAGLKPPSPGISGDQAQMLGALQSLAGRDFDRTYLRQQALAHRSALTVTQAYAASGDAPAVRQAANAAGPLIASHLAMVERMRASTDAE